MPDLSAYQKNTEKVNNAGYHTPPPNFSNSLLGQQQQSHPSLNSNSGSGPAPPPAQFAYMIGTTGPNPMVHAGMQVLIFN